MGGGGGVARRETDCRRSFYVCPLWTEFLSKVTSVEPLAWGRAQGLGSVRGNEQHHNKDKEMKCASRAAGSPEFL